MLIAVLFVLFQTFSARRISFSVVTLWLSTMVVFPLMDAFTDVSGIFTVVFSYLDSDGKIAHCYSDKGMYRVRE